MLKPTLLYVSVLSALGLAHVPVMAQEVASSSQATPARQLNDVVVRGNKKKVHRRDNEITGLGKIVKSTDTLNKEQVHSIRDLTRYDPGVAVVEQGRGASSGYSIRGVDRNRVSLSVDGLPQVQSYEVLRSTGSSGAINEIEYENVRAIEISKGASSAEYGSGSLGGAVGFVSKQASDILQPGRRYGIQNKTVYTSKNRQFSNSTAVAIAQEGFEGLAVYTHRRGREIQVHEDAAKRPFKVRMVGAYRNVLELRANPDERSSGDWFITEAECPSGQVGEGGCTPKKATSITSERAPTRRSNPPFSEAEEREYAAQLHPEVTLSGSDYTGPNRIQPNPMDYRTNSLLLRGGYRFNDRHHIGLIAEHTRQRYDIEDRTMPRYFTPEERDFHRFLGLSWYQGDQYIDGAFVNPPDTTRARMGLRWSRTLFIDEQHDKARHGALYTYTNPDKDGWVDNASLSLDRQFIQLNNFVHLHHCAEYPTVDKTCRPSVDKPWSFYESERNIYSETHRVAQLNVEKQWRWGNTVHRAHALVGANWLGSTLTRGDYFNEHAAANWEARDNFSGRNGSYERPYWYRFDGVTVTRRDYCAASVEEATGLSDCTPRHITGYNAFMALRDHMSIGQYVDLGLGLRYDRHRLTSDDPWTGSIDSHVWSWNAGVVLKPTANVSLSYRISTGFRAPSFQELFGDRTPGFIRGKDDDVQYVSKLSPEKALNNEIGLSVRGDFGVLESSFFWNRYRDMISVASVLEEDGSGVKSGTLGYHNAQSIDLLGMNVQGKIDWSGVFNRAPEGLYSTVAFNWITPVRVSTYPQYTHVASPLLDALQPARLIAGLGYDDPEDRWGMNVLYTYSRGKSNEELQGTKTHGTVVYQRGATRKRTRPWNVLDITAYYTPTKWATLRAGVYNVFNTRYLSWEAVRQSSVNSIHTHRNVGNYARYAAPGRNFSLSLELKY